MSAESLGPNIPAITPSAGSIIVDNVKLANVGYGDVRSMIAHEEVHVVQYLMNPKIMFNVAGREIAAYQFQVDHYAKFNSFGGQTIPKSYWQRCVVLAKNGNGSCGN